MTQKLNIDIVAKDRSKQALNGVQKSLGRLKNSVFNLRNAFLGLGAGLVVRNLVNTGKQLENLRTRLKFLLKDTNEGAKLLTIWSSLHLKFLSHLKKYKKVLEY